MSTPFPPEEPFGEEEIHRVGEEAEEHAEEVRREHASEHDEAAGERGDRAAPDVPWWRRLFRRS
ncbi:MAG TPA: hypothetical protein VF984_01190 [Actinomycetota bacterium]